MSIRRKATFGVADYSEFEPNLPGLHVFNARFVEHLDALLSLSALQLRLQATFR
jgi:hypothetical protein